MAVLSLVLGISILLQFAAAFFALRLTRVTGRRTAWAFIAAAVSLMALRRCITLFGLISGSLPQPPDLLAELVALGTSALMVVGVARIASLFLSIKRAEEALRESEQCYRTLFEQADDAIFLETGNEEIVDVNRRACQLTGYTREELLSMKTSDLEAPEMRVQPAHGIYSEPDLIEG